MQERFLFRGKRFGNSKVPYGDGWAIGYLFQAPKTLSNSRSGISLMTPSNANTIVSDDVDPATIGQCTGLKDKNGKLIFEGDIIIDGHSRTGIVKWKEEGAYMYSEFIKPKTMHNGALFSANTLESKYVEIIGNIYDNPELLEVNE